jgi:hypothetical protein
MKAIHRLLVTSNAYRMRSSGWEADHPNAIRDPDNLLLWRMNPRRMESEVVRDSLLQLTGLLDTAMGGPELDETKGHEIYRRSVYFRHAPDLQMDFLKVFDSANPNECFRRSESVVPQQALALANSPLSFNLARILARKLTQQAGTGEKASPRFIAAAFETLLGRAPSKGELLDSVQFLNEQALLFANPAQLKLIASGPGASVKPAQEPDLRARENLVHVLFNHNEFVTIR